MFGIELTEAEFEGFRGLIYRIAGIRIPETKRIMMTNRLRRRLRDTGIETFSAYYTFLTSPAGRGEIPSFLDAITTNETYFLRDPHHYEWFGETFLPEIARQARSRPAGRGPRIWSAACATGEELYSLALKVQVHRPPIPGGPPRLLGTDISNAALELARAGSYDARALRLISPVDRSTHFDLGPGTGRWTLKPGIKAMVSWKRHNLLEPIDDGPFDCIFLKNVLIYFDADSKKVVIRNLLAALAEGGYLVVGPTEGVYNLLGSLQRVKTWLYRRPARGEG